MGRHSDPRGRLDPLDADLQTLAESVRNEYLTDPLVHAQVQAAARVLIRLHPDIYRSLGDAVVAGLVILGAMDMADHVAPQPED